MKAQAILNHERYHSFVQFGVHKLHGRFLLLENKHIEESCTRLLSRIYPHKRRSQMTLLDYTLRCRSCSSNPLKGLMYLGLDAWQSPNGFNILGTVGYRLIGEDNGGFELEAMPLDFVRLKQSHTGLYLDETVQLIVEKFGLKEKICGIVTDNASNNKTMIEAIKSYRWPRFKGKTQWIRCFAQILNLIVQETGDSGDDEDDKDSNLSKKDAELVGRLINNDEIELKDEDVNEMSDEDEDDRYTSKSCKESLSKFRAISRKLNKSPNSKALFVELCQDLECASRTQLDVILEWQRDKRHGPSREYHINSNNIDLARDLIEVLQPFYNITLQVSTRGGAQISDVVVFIDQITSHLSTAISKKKDDFPPALRNACRAGLQLTNKYYTLTDCSPLYRVAMVLHPSFKDEYFKLANWNPEWIEEAIRLTREMWETQYKPPPPQPSNSQPTAPRQQTKTQTGVLAGFIMTMGGPSTPSNGGHNNGVRATLMGVFSRWHLMSLAVQQQLLTLSDHSALEGTTFFSKGRGLVCLP
ncbi:uncharacterized protein PGTG_11195 [Puccinia graminis f. sp. tritici CRL 75-36-700-3]|uniref:DUF659 domain-containing protein n=1 Tax=Puccinia graminis f. sp. tritici (strain CRL 75-36-700-3 / race SCCL) TaxID=418459 RepID=E3KL51_PUCGT|nr:uncharacterized protein PGTG_11195 [Puccinia graminis f. sp. tritici CRL 75-36-700-3]EFP85026.2 hypothetical protein PGTG_11195 [Puccinia graminis f. sp. tritici CRL 75-36-700-3]